MLEASRIESFTDTNVTSSASNVQPAALPRFRNNPKMGVKAEGKDKDKDIGSCGAAEALPIRRMVTTPAARTNAM